MGKFDNVMIASDLDGTFLSSEIGEVARNIERIKYFTANGGTFTFSTGRIGPHVLGRLPRSREYVNAPIVACNGMSLFDLASGRPVSERYCDPTLIVETLDHLYKKFPNIAYRGMSKDGIVYFQPENPFIADEMKGGSVDFFYAERADWDKFDIFKITLRDTPEVLARVKKYVEQRYAEEYALCFSWDTLLEIQPKGITKATLLLELRDMLSGEGLPKKLYAVGDYENDLEMLALADVAVCPSNAIQSVKDICHLCLCDNDSGVIADLIDIIDTESE